MKPGYQVPEGAAAERLDVFLAAAAGLSRSRAGHLIRDGAVTVNGALQRASYLVQPGDTLAVAQAPSQPNAPLAAPNLPIIYEDADLLVVEKPAGLIVHAGVVAHGQSAPATVADFARTRVADTDPDRPGIVHRLDRDTSGLLVLAKTAAAKLALQRQFRQRDVHKTYLALVVGHPRPAEAVINLPVGRHPNRPLEQAVVPGGRDAVTSYRTLEDFRGYSLVEVQPATGRTHQIRVHLAAIGHPVAGDVIYGPKIRPLGLRRQFLHAAELQFITPSGRELHLASQLPADLAAALTKLKNQV